MTEIDVFSGFLGAGKTTLIKKLIKEAYAGEKIVLIENEFGEIGIDGGFMKEAGIEVTEMNSGCICCSLVGDFGAALEKVLDEIAPDRILIEPSGVGKLSDVLGAVEKVDSERAKIGGIVTVVDASKFKIYSKNFGEFFYNQIENAATIILSRTDNVSEKKLNDCIEKIREKNPDAILVTTPWEQLSGAQILEAVKKNNTLKAAIEELEHHHEHHHEHDEHCTCGCHDHDHDRDHDHEHHHEHHHEHDEHCTCGCHDHDHDHEHHHHHADEVFTSWGIETAKAFSKEELTEKLEGLMDESKYGFVLRAKGIVAGVDGNWIHFDYVPGEADVRNGAAEITGRLCVVGSKLNKERIAELFE
ncbi:MAG: GTP-binding protein [Clostridia bacterium]|nr:GTP-binding protein [Clostridia bacterium]